MPDKNARRAQRECAVASLNTVARALEIEPIPVRASAEEVTELFESLCEKGSAEHAASAFTVQQQVRDPPRPPYNTQASSGNGPLRQALEAPRALFSIIISARGGVQK